MELVQSTMKSYGLSVNNILGRFSVKTTSGNVLNLRITLLPKDRYEEFIDLYMKYFVPYEKIHIGTGMPYSTEALNEYRKVLSEYLKNESLHKVICCLDSDETATEIYGGVALKLYRKDDPCDDRIEIRTEQIEKLKKIEITLDYLVPVANIMTKYSIDRYYELISAFVRSDMRQMGILKELVEASMIMCQVHCVPVIAAWCTSVGSQKLSYNLGWELIYEISCKDFGQLVDVNFGDDPPTIKLMIQRNLKRSNL